jgi:hypothetical protein
MSADYIIVASDDDWLPNPVFCDAGSEGAQLNIVIFDRSIKLLVLW